MTPTVRIEPAARRPGFVTSHAVLRLFEFLEASGGAPPEACGLLFRKPSEARRRMDSLRAAGFAARAFLGDEELWLPRVHTVWEWEPASFLRQRALGWFAARLSRSGGRYADGRAEFPNGRSMPVAVLPYDALPSPPCVIIVAAGHPVPPLPPGSFWCREEDLGAQELPQCLRHVPARSPAR